jgi:DHA1 family inner membrane transport protein
MLGGVIFLIGTTEFMIAGLLPEVSAAFDVSQSRAGLLITSFAVGMIVGAPAMAVATLRMPRRAALLAALAVFAVGHLVAAISTSFWLLVATRFVTAIAVGAFWAVGAAIASIAAGPESRARAMGVMIGGLTLANVIGVPLGTAAGQALGWRGPFWVLSGLAVAAMPLISRHVSSGGERSDLSVRTEIGALRNYRLLVVLLAAALSQAGLIACFSYVSPLLTDRAGLASRFVVLVLFGFGVGAVVGTIVGGRLGDRRPFATVIVAIMLTAGVLAATAMWASNAWTAVPLVVLLGTAAFTATPILGAQALHAASDAPTLASALSTSSFNIGVAGGSWLGGVALSTTLGLRGPALVGLVLTLAGLVPLAYLARTRQSTQSGLPDADLELSADRS